uniref:Uncharacterized protein n=1 Tax=Xenopus tropicalis TaxID=8364 RepID=A0A1B8XY74_XENTR
MTLETPRRVFLPFAFSRSVSLYVALRLGGRIQSPVVLGCAKLSGRGGELQLPASPESHLSLLGALGVPLYIVPSSPPHRVLSCSEHLQVGGSLALGGAWKLDVTGVCI